MMRRLSSRRARASSSSPETPGRDEAAVPRLGRQLGGEAPRQFGREARQGVHAGRQGGEGAGHLGRGRGQGIGLACEKAGDPLRRGEAVAQAAEIARAAPAEGQTRQGAGHVAGALQFAAQSLAQIAPLGEPGHGVEPRLDGRGREERAREAGGQQPRPGRAHRAVEGGEERALPAAREGPLDLEAGAGGRIDGHGVGLGRPARRGEGRSPAALRRLQVGGDQAQRRHLGPGERAEAVQGLDAIEALEPGLRGGRLGQGRGHGLDDGPRGLQGLAHHRIGEQAVGGQELGRAQRGQGGGQALGGEAEAFDLAGGELHAGHRRAAGAQSHGGQPIGPARVQEALLGQGARRHHPDDLAAHDGLGAPLAGRGRILHLLADGHLEAGPDQLGQIGLGRVGRHAGHGDRRPGVDAALGERDADGGGRLHRVVEEHLVEIAHAEKDQGVGLARLGREILRHHRRSAGGAGRRVGNRRKREAHRGETRAFTARGESIRQGPG